MKMESILMVIGFEVCMLYFVYSLILNTASTGKRHGRGEYMYNDGSKYIGQWDNDKINGEGTSWYPNGNK
jgi:hypothetical protein